MLTLRLSEHVNIGYGLRSIDCYGMMCGRCELICVICVLVVYARHGECVLVAEPKRRPIRRCKSLGKSDAGRGVYLPKRANAEAGMLCKYFSNNNDYVIIMINM